MHETNFAIKSKTKVQMFYRDFPVSIANCIFYLWSFSAWVSKQKPLLAVTNFAQTCFSTKFEFQGAPCLSPGWVQVPLLNNLHTPEGYFGLSLLLLGLELMSGFFLGFVEPGFAACVTFFRTSKADHLAETSCADKKNLSSSQACALNLMISSMKSARTVNLSE